MSPSKKNTNSKTIASNRKAYHNYEVIESLEAGISLTGTEIKSIRSGKISLQEAHARILNGQVSLYGLYIAPYEQGGFVNHEPTRERKLLLHKKEIAKLEAKTQEKGLTLIPLKLYFSRCWAKVELGLCRGKKQYDKRESIKAREQNRTIQRLAKHNYSS